MIEVEAKAKIKDPVALREKAQKIGEYLGCTIKIDDYYTLENGKKYPMKSLRLRRIDKIYQINFKQSMSFNHRIHAKKETEFTVGNIDDYLCFLKEFGFKKWLRKEKRSEVYGLERNFHIELNFVKELGWFVEVEYLAHPEEKADAEKKVLRVMKSLGIKEKDFINKGYTRLLWEKNKKKK
jgi:predicted adenylyl cyclase CyaB